MITCPHCGTLNSGSVKQTLHTPDTIVLYFFCPKCQSGWFDEFPDTARIRYLREFKGAVPCPP